MSLAPTFSAPITFADRADGLQQTVERPEQSQKDQRADQIARGLARLVEPRGDAVEQRLQRCRRQRHPAALATAQHARHRREHPRRRPRRHRQVAIGESLAKIVDPGARRFELDDLSENVRDAGDQQPEDDAVECRVAQERVQQRRPEHDRDRDDNGEEQRHPEYEPVRSAHAAPLVVGRFVLAQGDRKTAPEIQGRQRQPRPTVR